MKLVILNKSEKPIYEQLYEQISSQIMNGELPPNYCLPSIRALAAELGISIITVKKALEMLEFNEFIYTRAGKGCFVSDHAPKRLEDKKREIATEELKKNLPFYRNLNLTAEELIDLIRELY